MMQLLMRIDALQEQRSITLEAEIARVSELLERIGRGLEQRALTRWEARRHLLIAATQQIRDLIGPVEKVVIDFSQEITLVETVGARPEQAPSRPLDPTKEEVQEHRQQRMQQDTDGCQR